MNMQDNTVVFGNYAGKPIKWQVIEQNADGSCILLSQYGLTAKPYHKELEMVTWEKCSLRKWLNEEFYEVAFTDEEKSRIKLTNVANPDNTLCGTIGGNDTQDHVFLLDLEGANRYFANDAERVCYQTPNAAGNSEICWWWLRSPGYLNDIAASVDIGGFVGICGDIIYHTNGYVRPVIVVMPI